MATAASLLAQKGADGGAVISVTPDATVKHAVNLMNDNHIGCVTVVDARGHLVGVFSERDLLKRVVGKDLDADATQVADVMTRDVIVCTPETTLDEIRATMREKRIRHIPVIEEHGGLLGMISIGDVNIAETKVLTETITYLQQYMTRS